MNPQERRESGPPAARILDPAPYQQPLETVSETGPGANARAKHAGSDVTVRPPPGRPEPWSGTDTDTGEARHTGGVTYRPGNWGAGCRTEYALRLATDGRLARLA